MTLMCPYTGKIRLQGISHVGFTLAGSIFSTVSCLSWSLTCFNKRRNISTVMLNYPYYYHRTIQSYPIGFKLVLGGTGLGKTSGIRDVICMPEYQERKFIYVANRVQLLEEMGQSLTQHHPGCYVLLRRDLEIVLHTLKTSNSDFYELLRDSLFLDNLDRWNQRSVLRRIDLAAVKRSCKALEEMMQETQGMTLPRLLEEQADEHAHLVLNAFKSALLAANNKSGNAPSYERLADHPVIQSLFPCIAFKRRPEVRLMLVTLQKALYGFFDGRQTLNLTRLEDADGGYVIFLDEFDFLENDLVGLICRAPQINNPFRLVEFFYRAMAQHKLPLETYPQPLETYPPNIRKRILGIVDDIEQLRQASLLFPTINQFTSSLPQRAATSRRKTSGEAKASPAIFRTRHIISTDPLYLQQTNRSFDLVSEPAPSTHSAFHLFDVVSHACEQILLLFKELERANEDIIHREMLRHCFQDTRFAEDIRLISQFSPPHHEQSTQLGTLLDAGYSLYDIHDLQ
jgi:thiaminase